MPDETFLIQPDTPLTKRLAPAQAEWLLQFCAEDFSRLHLKLTDWRASLSKWEKQADEDFNERATLLAEDDNAEPRLSIFHLQNDSLNVVGGFADMAFATAREDITGTRPFFSATPEGAEDLAQAEIITKHAHWKLGQTNLEESLNEAARTAINLGTSLPKSTWRRITETSYRDETVLADAKGKPLMTGAGEYIYPGEEENFKEEIPEGATMASLRTPKDPDMIIPEDVQWVETPIEETEIIFDNVQTDCIRFDKFAADPDAPRLDLLETNVYHEFEIGLLDACERYEIAKEHREELIHLANSGGLTQGTSGQDWNAAFLEIEANPKIRLIEGYLRVDPFKTGSPSRIYVVLSACGTFFFKADYLANITPGGRLPIFAVSCYRKPRKWMGVGFYERYAKVQDYIDSNFSATGYRNRYHSNPTHFVDMAGLEEDIEEDEFTIQPGKTYVKKPGVKMDDIIESFSIPDLDNRTIELMNIMLQVGQMRTGISSAAQGELSALPDTNTATGVKSILSRGATLLKWPIGEIASALEKKLNYDVVLLYANQNYDETFTWGEGRDAQLLQLDEKAASTLHYHVRILLTQSQSQEKLETANAAIGIMGQYTMLPELEKEAQRPLYIQAISSLGFESVEDIVRPAIIAPPTEPGAEAPVNYPPEEATA